MGNAKLRFGISVTMFLGDSFKRFRTWHSIAPTAHRVPWVSRESLLLLVVQEVVVYASNEMFSWHLLCPLSLNRSLPSPVDNGVSWLVRIRITCCCSKSDIGEGLLFSRNAKVLSVLESEIPSSLTGHLP